MFLTRNELRDLSGYKRKAEIGRWLTENRYQWEPDRFGWPKVLRLSVEARFQARLGGPKLRAA